MRLRRLLSLATALGLAATMSVPTGALAHEIAETMVRFDGNYLMVSVDPGGPLTEVRLDVYQGKIGRVKKATLVTASAYLYDWESIPGSNACRVEWTAWTGQLRDAPSAPNVVDVYFTSPYDGSLEVAFEGAMHGELRTYDGVLGSGGTWCDRELEPTSVRDLGEVNFAAAATWDSVVVLKGKKLVTVRTTVSFETLTFDDQIVDPDGEQTACSLARRMRIPVYEFVG